MSVLERLPFQHQLLIDTGAVNMLALAHVPQPVPVPSVVATLMKRLVIQTQKRWHSLTT